MTEPEVEVVDVIDPRAVVVRQQPGQAIINEGDRASSASEMIQRATFLADALADIVERKKLYSTISGKKFPLVEAWMIIARMDNVVARESQPPVRHDDGSYEAFAELLRLSDGMVIGRASALCGTPDDKPWNGRGEPQRRAMAATRATSRAFRQQYSWIMALAGYEPTPAEEMPADAVRADVGRSDDGGLIGKVEVGEANTSDFVLHLEATTGHTLGFRLRGDRGGILVATLNPLASQVYAKRHEIIGKQVTVWGRIIDVPPEGRKRGYQKMMAERMSIPDIGVLPVAEAPAGELTEAESEAIWSEINGKA